MKNQLRLPLSDQNNTTKKSMQQSIEGNLIYKNIDSNSVRSIV
jgi:hypothetical protein